MLYKIFLLFTIIPIVELIILIKLGQYIGLWYTIWLIVLTGAVGAVLAKRESLEVIHSIRRDLNEGILPGRCIVDGLLIFMGGVMLIVPGILTDVAGFVFIIPFTRYKIREKIIDWLRKKFIEGSFNISILK
jgi:UPF0716 protein FxsA